MKLKLLILSASCSSLSAQTVLTIDNLNLPPLSQGGPFVAAISQDGAVLATGEGGVVTITGVGNFPEAPFFPNQSITSVPLELQITGLTLDSDGVADDTINFTLLLDNGNEGMRFDNLGFGDFGNPDSFMTATVTRATTSAGGAVIFNGFTGAQIGGSNVENGVNVGLDVNGERLIVFIEPDTDPDNEPFQFRTIDSSAFTPTENLLFENAGIGTGEGDLLGVVLGRALDLQFTFTEGATPPPVVTTIEVDNLNLRPISGGGLFEGNVSVDNFLIGDSNTGAENDDDFEFTGVIRPAEGYPVDGFFTGLGTTLNLPLQITNLTLDNQGVANDTISFDLVLESAPGDVRFDGLGIGENFAFETADQSVTASITNLSTTAVGGVLDFEGFTGAQIIGFAFAAEPEPGVDPDPDAGAVEVSLNVNGETVSIVAAGIGGNQFLVESAPDLSAPSPTLLFDEGLQTLGGVLVRTFDFQFSFTTGAGIAPNDGLQILDSGIAENGDFFIEVADTTGLTVTFSPDLETTFSATPVVITETTATRFSIDFASLPNSDVRAFFRIEAASAQ